MKNALQSLVSPFNSVEARESFLKAYDCLLDSWDVETESLWVQSDFGDTHIIVSGPPEASPLVLIPGVQATAAMWGPMIANLSSNRRVYSIDLIDQVGRSRPKRILSSTREAVGWLEQTLDGLNLSKVDIAGNSLGSFLAASFASYHPDRIGKIVLTAPAGVVSEISSTYILQVIVAVFLPLGLKDWFLRKASANNISSSSPFYRLMAIAMKQSKVVSKITPRKLTDVELSSLKMPILFVLGELDSINKIRSSSLINEIKNLLADVKCEILPGAGHIWNDKQFQDCGKVVENFLG